MLMRVQFVRFNVSAPGSPPSQRGKYLSGTPPPPTTPYNSSPDMKMEIVPTSPVSPLLMENGAIDHDIDLNRIRQGEDLRTTLMIRHIPNRVSAVRSFVPLLCWTLLIQSILGGTQATY